MTDILILNGPNLNMLGRRDPALYGHETLEDIGKLCAETAQAHDLGVDFRQSNHEGELVTWVQDALDTPLAGLIINAGAYTHTSIALYDALELLTVPVVEVHLSEPQSREPFRHVSYIEPLAAHRIAGKGAQGYAEAVTWLADNRV